MEARKTSLTSPERVPAISPSSSHRPDSATWWTRPSKPACRMAASTSGGSRTRSASARRARTRPRSTTPDAASSRTAAGNSCRSHRSRSAPPRGLPAESSDPWREREPSNRLRSMQHPETRYTRSGDLNIAYQVVGDGPLDLVYVPGWISNVELNWDEPSHAHVLERLARFSRLILFDKRGTGLSDPVPLDRLPPLEERMDDVRAVLDAVGSTRTAVFGFSEGGLMSILFAATHPERVTALALYGTFAKRIWSPDYPWAPKPDARAREIEQLERDWATRMDLDQLAPSEDDAFKQRLATYFR